MKSPVLGYIKNKEIIGVRAISSNEYADLNRSFDEINRYFRSSELLSYALFNHDDFFKSLNDWSVVFRDIQDVGRHNLDRAVFDLNSKILNFLASVRTFLDHNETNVKRYYGEEEKECFKTICADHYDGGFAYRFLYKLRNYSQHCGMPIGNLSINSYKEGNDLSDTRVDIILTFDRDELLSRFDGWKSLKEELSSMPKNFDVTPLVQEMVFRLGDIHLSLVEILFKDIKEEAESVLRLHSEITENNSKVIILDSTGLEEVNPTLSYKEIPVQQANWILQDLQTLSEDKTQKS